VQHTRKRTFAVQLRDGTVHSFDPDESPIDLDHVIERLQAIEAQLRSLVEAVEP
jgi:hypothetical protein